jgi:hypothetical protein
MGWQPHNGFWLVMSNRTYNGTKAVTAAPYRPSDLVGSGSSRPRVDMAFIRNTGRPWGDVSMTVPKIQSMPTV